MGFNTRDATQKSMSSDVRDWCDSGDTDDRRTVVLTLSDVAETAMIESELEAAGARIVSAGPGAAVVSINPEATRAVSRIRGVVRMEMPTRLDPKRSKP